MSSLFSIGDVRVLVVRLLRSWDRDGYARALAAELEAHVALHTADQIRQGLPRTEALREARLQLGGVLQARERCLDAMTFRWLARQLPMLQTRSLRGNKRPMEKIL